MGDFDPSGGQAQSDNSLNLPSTSSSRRQSDSFAFHSQLEYFTQSQQPSHQNVPHYGQQPFDMGALAGALPQSGQSQMNQLGQYGAADARGVPSSSLYRMQQASGYPGGPAAQFDPMVASRMQQQQYSQYGSISTHGQIMPRQQNVPFHAQGPQGNYAQFDPYAYGMSPVPVSPHDARLGPQGQFGMASGMPGDFGQYSRRASEPAPVPSFPRGPPRKPKQSGHALWVGNLPPNALVTDLKDHFSRDATQEIESLFLISKSNCAFVNYRSEAACVAAMNRFHDSRFHGVRLVCRLRRGAATGLTPTTSNTDISGPPSSNESPATPATPAVAEEPTSPTIVGSPSTATAPTQAPSGQAAVDGSHKVPEKYFVVKSLTVQDLEASVRNGIWATQSHNEKALNQAYNEAENVFLIFSANKSGEYFGYARMASTISGEPVNLTSSFAQAETRSTGVPQSIPTPATATAPKGRIIDDSARGTIFWEAEHSDEGDEETSEKENNDSTDGQNWGRQFAIEWMSTARLPFYRTRGLRNPWNANREVKIARDGTEIEPSVGRRLVQMFNRPSPSPVAPQVGAPFR